MRLAGRFLVILSVSVGPAVVTSIGCGVDTPQYPGLANQVPNILGSGSPVLGAGGSSTATTTTTTTGSGGGGGGGTGGSTAGPAQSLCDIAAALGESGSHPCGACEQSQGCLMQYTTCGTPCSNGGGCVFGCSGDASCISQCILDYSAYASFLNCMMLTCASSCGVEMGIACCWV